MLEPIIIAAVVFVATFVLLMGVEKLIHKLTHNPDRSYRWGVWTFSLLATAYAYATALGR